MVVFRPSPSYAKQGCLNLDVGTNRHIQELLNITKNNRGKIWVQSHALFLEGGGEYFSFLFIFNSKFVTPRLNNSRSI